MADRRVEDYAYQNSVSNKEAKRRLKGKRNDTGVSLLVQRGGPVAGTGKPKGE